ncbi:hypothetical protein EJD97_000352 [Solanum chilense]|uniref:Uncharacterized protein n=1 Tax=Solanum chilense TaxID=4083 RepID=A0A6N2AQG7_SOLCI|nr:hypothetical protein EJD97_000352 [Solanum chilense]
MLQLPQLEVMVRVPASSDHSPLKIDLKRDDGNDTPRTFKFFNCIADHLEFIYRVRGIWNSRKTNDIKEVWRKLKQVRNEIKHLNHVEFRGVADRVKDIRNELQQVQENMNDPTKVTLYRQLEWELQSQLEK